jgi:hypothetical protein
MLTERFKNENKKVGVKNTQANIATLNQYKNLIENPLFGPKYWHQSCVSSESSMHQLSPYIGKLKSVIARDLVSRYSKPGDLIIDPFSGSGTIPLEAALQGRQVFAADISPYSKVLCKAKLSHPYALEQALTEAESIINEAKRLPDPDLRYVPQWVRNFFHPKTLKEAINFSVVCKRKNNEFIMACFLGILHHQRPGFLSYPSSHLVPYLRDKKFPKSLYPDMYKYRELQPRLISKIKRAYKHNQDIPRDIHWEFRQSSIENLSFPDKFNCLITSPPYMNTLDYGRDNRLRLWFINSKKISPVDNPMTNDKKSFEKAITIMAEKIDQHLLGKGYCIIIVGEKLTRNNFHLSKSICTIFSKSSPSLSLSAIIRDEIPDIRRSRKDCKGTKSENILVFQRE